MKRLILRLIAIQLIILNLTTYFIFSVEEEQALREPIFFQLDSEQQLDIIEQGIKSILNSIPYPLVASFQAYKYLDKAITANEFLYSKRSELTDKLKLWAKERFASEYEI